MIPVRFYGSQLQRAHKSFIYSDKEFLSVFLGYACLSEGSGAGLR